MEEGSPNLVAEREHTSESKFPGSHRRCVKLLLNDGGDVGSDFNNYCNGNLAIYAGRW